MHLSSFPSFRRACRLGFGLAAFVLPLTFFTPDLRAQMPKVFVSLHGSDGNTGASTSPKRTFQAAHDAVNAGGEIVVLDTAGYGALTISKSLTITVPTGASGFVTVGDNNGITIQAASTDNVSIRGLTIESDGTSSTNQGISAQSVGQLDVEDCTIRGFALGMVVYANSVSDSATIRRCVVRDCPTGVFNQSTASSSPGTVALDHVTINHCSEGVSTDSGSNYAASTTLVNCIVHNCDTGISASHGASNFVDGCTVSGSGTVGVRSFTSGANYSRGNNLFTSNTDNGTFDSSVSAH